MMKFIKILPAIALLLTAFSSCSNKLGKEYKVDSEHSVYYKGEGLDEYSAQKLGDYLKKGYFVNGQKATVQMEKTKDTKDTIYLNFVVDKSKATSDIEPKFMAYAKMISSDVFNNMPLNIKWMDDKFDEVKNLGSTAGNNMANNNQNNNNGNFRDMNSPNNSNTANNNNNSNNNPNYNANNNNSNNNYPASDPNSNNSNNNSSNNSNNSSNNSNYSNNNTSAAPQNDDNVDYTKSTMPPYYKQINASKLYYNQGAAQMLPQIEEYLDGAGFFKNAAAYNIVFLGRNGEFLLKLPFTQSVLDDANMMNNVELMRQEMEKKFFSNNDFTIFACDMNFNRVHAYGKGAKE